LSQSKRLIFAIDATMSANPLGSRREIQTDMFKWPGRGRTRRAAGLLSRHPEFKRANGRRRPRRLPSACAVSAAAAARRNCAACCPCGREARRTKVGALVYIGDCFEESPDAAATEAAKLALLGIPAFMFHEGHDPTAAAVFGEIARLTHGVYARFDAGAARSCAIF